MISKPFQLLSLLSILTPTLCARLAISIPPSQLLPNPSTLPSSTHATLHAHGAPISAHLTRSNKFFFDDVAPGSYLLNVHCRDYHFEPLRIDIVTNDTVPGGEYVTSWQTFRGNEWENKGESRGQGYGADPEGVKIETRPAGVKDYYQPRQGFSILSFLKNPMILMALFSLAMIVGMPYLLDNMDPESRAEFEQIQKQNPLANAANPAAALGNFDFASWMAGRGNEQESDTSAQKNGPREGQGTARRR